MLKGHGEPAFIMQIQTGSLQIEDDLSGVRDAASAHAALLADDAPTDPALLKAVALAAIHAELRERTRLAELLHDGLQQLLVAAKMRVSRPRRQPSSEEDATTLLEVKQLIQQAIETSRTLTTELRPPILYQQGLAAAIQWLGKQTKLLYEMDVTSRLDTRAEPANHDVKAFLYQAIRELVFNAVKHAGVREVSIVSTICKPGTLRISVEDQGVGFSIVELKRKQAANEGLGLFAMENRIVALGGSIRIEARPGGGTSIHIELPLEIPMNASAKKMRAENSNQIASAVKWNMACSK